MLRNADLAHNWIVKYLLEQGVQVHGTLRNLADQDKIGHLLEMQTHYPYQLFLFEADLSDKESFGKPMEGCNIVSAVLLLFKVIPQISAVLPVRSLPRKTGIPAAMKSTTPISIQRPWLNGKPGTSLNRVVILLLCFI